MTDEDYCELCEKEYHLFEAHCKDADIPYGIQIKVMMSHIILGAIKNGFVNQDFMNFVEEYWYSLAPQIKKRLDAIS